MRPERVFGIHFTFASVENATAFAAQAAKIVAPYSRFAEIQQIDNVVRVQFQVDSIGEELYKVLNAQLLALASNFA